ncbi:MAG TPA: ATP-binding protein [Nannocystaceae bacterium]|nr:ATP-binding protein [Nannocystaceae bacterium]
METRAAAEHETEAIERLADVATMVRACEIVLGGTTLALASFATWFALTGATQPWVAIVLWAMPILNILWNVLVRRGYDVRIELARMGMFLPVCAVLYGGASGPLEHLRIPALAMAVGMGVVNGVATRSPNVGYAATICNVLALLVGAWMYGDPPSFTRLVDVAPVCIGGFIIAMISAKLGRSLADARSRRREAEQGRVELEIANARLKTEIRRAGEMEVELRLAQKLQAVGQLAAGIGHEINTPIQYVSDNVEFLRASFERIEALRLRGHELVEHSGDEVRLAELRALERRSRLEYLAGGIPKAFESATQGLDRIAKIVRALKLLSHCGDDERAAIDVGQLVLATLEVARGEYKLVADVQTDLAAVPPVLCSSGEIGQVLLNLIVNAAHAITDVVGSSGERGTIRASTRRDGEQAVISISDTGGGIPAEIRDRIFEPFFTTKDVGRGSGQGLAISRAIVDRHSGSVTLETSPAGTTFHVRLPLAA